MALGRLCGLGEHSCRSTFSNANRYFDSKSNCTPVGWYAIQKLFEVADSDVLLLLDCCAAASAAPADAESLSVTEIIAACGFETLAPLPGRHSFTDTLIVVLEEWKRRTSFTAAMLHCEILRRLRHEKPEKRGNTDRKFECRKTPILVVSTNNPDARSIELFPRRIASHIPNDVTPVNVPNIRGASFSKFLPDAKLDNNESPVAASISEAAKSIHQTGNLYDKDSLLNILDNGDTALPHVIITVALEEEPHSTLDFGLWKRWLEQFPALAKYVKVQGVYKSNSTLMILSIPVIVWNWIPEDPACIFIGYIHSDNILVHTTPVAKVVDRHVESVEPLKDQLDKSMPISSVTNSGTPSPTSSCPATKPASPRHMTKPTSPRRATKPTSPHRATKPTSYHPRAENDDHQNLSENSWRPEFSTFREIRDETRLVDVREEPHAMGDDFEIFSTSYGDNDSRFEVERVKDFCRGESLTDVVTGNGPAGLQRIAWIDDRVSGPGLERRKVAMKYKNPLTATGLFRALVKPRFNDKCLPDAMRRLIYVTDLSPACVYALMATASMDQAPVLRDAMSKYLAFQTSIAVKIPSRGSPTFQLGLHLPFFILDKSPLPKESLEKAYVKPQRQWTDLSFLKLDICESQGEVWGIQEAQISFVVTGTDNWRWTAYGFVDTEIDGFLADSTFDDLSCDQIAAQALEANFQIWDPRDYWVRVFEIRVGYVGKQWLYLIPKLEHSINEYVRDLSQNTLNHPFDSINC
jgi:hypothetical protein